MTDAPAGEPLFGDKSRVEIERKFLLRSDAWRRDGVVSAVRVRQGFLSRTERSTVRVRVVPDRGVITIKGPTTGFSREEYEYAIPREDAEQILARLCEGTLIDKTRFRIPKGGVVWEIDEFHGENEGLVLAEVELEREDQELSLPEWIGDEVSNDRRYFNAYLAGHPYRSWGG
jgi:CYTH domain-containing protein